MIFYFLISSRILLSSSNYYLKFLYTSIFLFVETSYILEILT